MVNRRVAAPEAFIRRVRSARGTLSSEGVIFSVPVGSLVAFTLVAIAAGVLAAVLPARRAARLDVLDALHYE